MMTVLLLSGEVSLLLMFSLYNSNALIHYIIPYHKRDICKTVKMTDLHALVKPVTMMVSRTVKARHKSLSKYYFGQELYFLLFASPKCQGYEYMELYLHSSYTTSWCEQGQLYLCSHILVLQGRSL
jgi:hypothetical protein